MCNKSPPENLEYRPEFLRQIRKISQNCRNFNFVTSRLTENFPSLQIPGKIFRFPEEFCVCTETALLIVDIPPLTLSSAEALFVLDCWLFGGWGEGQIERAGNLCGEEIKTMVSFESSLRTGSLKLPETGASRSPPTSGKKFGSLFAG